MSAIAGKVHGFAVTIAAIGQWKGGVAMSKVLTATDLLQMGYVDDPLLLEDVSLCQLCSYTCSSTAKTIMTKN